MITIRAAWLAPVTGLLLVTLDAAAAPAAAVSPPAAAGPAAPAAPAAPPTRGRLLYETHCVACHTTQMHWRDQRIVQDWDGLLAQVRAWQARANLNWPDADIEAVARHLNDHIYKLPAAPVRGE